MVIDCFYNNAGDIMFRDQNDNVFTDVEFVGWLAQHGKTVQIRWTDR